MTLSLFVNLLGHIGLLMNIGVSSYILFNNLKSGEITKYSSTTKILLYLLLTSGIFLWVYDLFANLTLAIASSLPVIIIAYLDIPKDRDN